MNNTNTKTVHVGFNNSVIAKKIIAVINSDSNPSKRLISDARTNGRLIDATEGRRTRAVIVMEGGYAVLSALMPETLVSRVEGTNEEEQ